MDKEAGKGLSTNDYSNDEKNKLAGIDAGANKYELPAATASTLGGVKQGDNITIGPDGTISAAADGTADWDRIANKPEFKPVATSGSYNDLSNTPSIPSAVSQLTNDSGYQKASDVATAIETLNNLLAAVAKSGSYSDLIGTPNIPNSLSQLLNDAGYQTAVDVAAAIVSAEFLDIVKVSVLPDISVAKTRTIYFLPKAVGETGNIFEEWLVIDGSWELIGTTAIDLSGYWGKDELRELTNAEIDAILALA